MPIAKLPLSYSVGGKQIIVAATATPGTALHVTGTSAAVVDEVWIYATNNDITPIVLTVEYGGTTAQDQIVITVPPKDGFTIIVPGLPAIGDGSAGKTIGAFASTASKISITGYVNRLS